MGQVIMTGAEAWWLKWSGRFIKERQREGIEKAKANGGFIRGGKRRVDRRRGPPVAWGGLGPCSAIAKAVGCSPDADLPDLGLKTQGSCPCQKDLVA